MAASPLLDKVQKTNTNNLSVAFWPEGKNKAVYTWFLKMWTAETHSF